MVIIAKNKNLEKKKEEILDKCGQVQEDIKKPKNERVHIHFQIFKGALDRIDEIVSKGVGKTRTGWILEALEEKLNKENK